MKTYCLVCKNYTDNNNLRIVKDKVYVEIRKICLLQRGLVYLIV